MTPDNFYNLLIFIANSFLKTQAALHDLKGDQKKNEYMS